MAVNDTFVFAEAIRCVVFVLILVAVIKSDKCQKLSYIAIALLFATDILPEIIECGFSHLFIGLLSGLLSAIFCSLPMALSIIAIHNNSNSQPIIARKATAPVFTTTEKLTKLKNLLDMGVITQEEFDAKKKELLNL